MATVSLKGQSAKYQVGNVFCVGRNYADHAKEMGNQVPAFPILFLKPASTMIHDGQTVIYPEYSQELHHEIELVVLIGSTLCKVSEAEAEQGIAAYGVGLDMTLRDLQNEFRKSGEPWTLAKCFDTCIVVSDFVPKSVMGENPDCELFLQVNGKQRQFDRTSSMIFKPAQIASYISHRITLQPGDLIFTGTPAGVSAVQRGDVLEAELKGFCQLKVNVG